MRQFIFILFVILCLTPLITPPIALFLGIIIVQVIGHPFPHLNKKATSLLLQVSVVGLGFSMNINSAVKATKESITFTILSICGTLVLGAILGKLFKIDNKTSFLVSSGTAICGGSAIAALSPVIEADEKQISVALGIVFILNAFALFFFPLLGNALYLNESQFGLWCAMAIHDTSSVVGAASRFGPHALEVATTLKLTRALWIIPITIITSVLFRRKVSKIKIPYFIGFFILAVLVNTYVHKIDTVASLLVIAAKRGLTLALFLIGTSLSLKVIKLVGIRPLLQGIILWVVISLITLWVVIQKA